MALNRKKENQKGQALIEYALIIAMVGILLVGSLDILRQQVAIVFGDAAYSMSTAGSPCGLRCGPGR